MNAKNPAVLTIAQMQAAAHAQSEKSGFWDEPRDTFRALTRIEHHAEVEPRLAPAYMRTIFAEKLALIHSEVTEALEAIRESNDTDWTKNTYREDGKPEGVPSELADILIRVGDLCGEHGIDLEAAVIEKMQFNATRPHKHGKKF